MFIKLIAQVQWKKKKKEGPWLYSWICKNLHRVLVIVKYDLKY